MKVLVATLILIIAGLATHAAETLPNWASAGKQTKAFHGYACYDLKVDGLTCKVVAPKEAATGKPWIWRARFWGHEPQTDKALLAAGFHVFYCEVGNLFGSPEAVARWDKAYAYVTETHGLSKKPALEGMSRGGLIIFNWAAANPDKVACIYGDAPVCDIRSWPGPKGGNTWAACKKAHGLTEETAKTFSGNPIDNVAPIAKAKIPVLAVCGAADTVVPMSENIEVFAKRLRELGGSIEIISKPGVGHHPHSLKDPKVIVDFVLKHTGQAK